MIKTVTLKGLELKVEELGGFNTFVQNLGSSTIYASKYPGIEAGADNVAEIPAGGGKLISSTNGTVYLLGLGKAEVTGLDGDGVIAAGGAAVFSAGGEGSGASLEEFMGYADAHDEATLDAAKEYAEALVQDKADKSEIPEIPTSLPANGGNADTVGGFTVGCDVPADAVFTDTIVDISGKADKSNPVFTGIFSLGRVPDSTIANPSVAIGNQVTASGKWSFAEGNRTTASRESAHAEGSDTIASGSISHAEGLSTTASGAASHASGAYTTAENYASFACGKYNKGMVAGGSSTQQKGDAFVIGNGIKSGSQSILSNALRVTYRSEVYGTGAFNTAGVDYAEYIKPWFDDNPDNEDRVGYFVTIKDGKLDFAGAGDYIIGITSGNPSIVGNSDEDWIGRWERDEFDRIKIVGTHFKESADYDPSQKYTARKDRPEWDYVGMIGVLPLRDDGTCVPGGFAKCGTGGIATKADEWECHRTFFVIERVSENVVKVEMR